MGMYGSRRLVNWKELKNKQELNNGSLQ
jgi:hypothetical protein